MCAALTGCAHFTPSPCLLQCLRCWHGESPPALRGSEPPRLTLPDSAHLALGSQPLLQSPEAGIGQQCRTAHPLCLPRLLFLSSCPSGGCSPPLPRCSVSLAAQPWRRCFQSLPARHGWEGEQWGHSSLQGPLCVCPRVPGLPWLVLVPLDADAGSGSCCDTQQELLPGEGCSAPLPVPLCVHHPPPACCPGCLGRFSWQEHLAGTVQLCPGSLFLVTVPLQGADGGWWLVCSCCLSPS